MAGRADSKRLSPEEVQNLAVVVKQLSEETRLLRVSLDELRDDVVWAARQILAAGEPKTPEEPALEPEQRQGNLF